MPLTENSDADPTKTFDPDGDDAISSEMDKNVSWEIDEKTIDKPVFKAHSQIDISEAGEIYKARDSETTATGKGETRGRALAELAAKLISGDYSDVDRPRLFELAGNIDDDAAEEHKQSVESTKKMDIKKGKNISFGE